MKLRINFQTSAFRESRVWKKFKWGRSPRKHWADMSKVSEHMCTKNILIPPQCVGICAPIEFCWNPREEVESRIQLTEDLLLHRQSTNLWNRIKGMVEMDNLVNSSLQHQTCLCRGWWGESKEDEGKGEREVFHRDQVHVDHFGYTSPYSWIKYYSETSKLSTCWSLWMHRPQITDIEGSARTRFL